MKWFFAFNEFATEWFEEMIKVAVISAQSNTTLMPHCIYDGENNNLTEWLKCRGVSIFHEKVPFKNELFDQTVVDANSGSLYRPEHASGAFLRTIAPQLCSEDVYLYTDCDVMFRKGGIVEQTTQTISAVREIDEHTTAHASGFNSGVLLCNTHYMLSSISNFTDRIRSSRFYNKLANSYDQVFLNQHHKSTWNQIDAVFNWRPFQGFSESSEIVHFHGPKPHRVHAILENNSLEEEVGLKALVDQHRAAYRHYMNEFYAFLRQA